MGFVLSRLVQMVLVVIAVTFLAFSALNFLGDPLFLLVGPIAEADPATLSERDLASIEQAQESFHLDEPFVVRYGLWLSNLVQGDFGRSIANQTTVSSILAQRLPVTALLMVMAQLIAVVVSIPWAVWSASKANRFVDKASTVLSFALLGLHVFALSVILFWLFSVRLDIFPTRYDDTTFLSQLWSLFLPSVVLSIPLIATYQRLLRTDLIATLQEDFIAVAKAKGMPSRHVLFRHALRPSLFSMLTVFGIQTGALIGGSIIVEQYFTVPGLGFTIIEAIFGDDFPVVLAIVVVVSVVFVVVNFLVDMLYSFLDPRVQANG